MQLMKDVMKIPKAHVAVAYNGLHPKFRYIGTKNIPPPRPNPLKIPAAMLICKTSLICD